MVEKYLFWGSGVGFVLLFWPFLMHLDVMGSGVCVSQEGNDPALHCLELLPNK